MKIITTAALLLITLTNVSAQEISSGLRTGIGSTFSAKELCNSQNTLTWDKEAYIRYETRGKVAAELRFQHYRTSEEDNSYQILYQEYDQPYTYTHYRANTISDYYSASFSAQYDITCPYLKNHCPIMKNMSNYLGLDINVTALNSTYISSTQRDSDENYYTYIDNRGVNATNFSFGISHTLVYRLNESININSSMRMLIAPNDFRRFFGGSDSRMNLLIGVGYTF